MEINYSLHRVIFFAGLVAFITHLFVYPNIVEGSPNLECPITDNSASENQTKASIIDIGFYNVSCGDLDVKLRPNIDISNSYVTNIQFTIKWPASPVDFINYHSDYDVELQGQVIFENDTNYAIFISTTAFPINWIAGNEYSVLTFSLDQSGEGYIDFVIDEGPWTKLNNGSYYVEFLGIDYTGFIYHNANNTFLGHCGNLDLTVYLEGSFNPLTGFMNTTLNSIPSFPYNQPYTGSPWNYPGSESLTEIHDGIVDWILIEFRDAPNAASATIVTQVGQKAALILENGKVTGMDGVSPILFNNSTIDQLFIVLWHRNHLGIISAYEIVPATEDHYTYDFSTAQSQAHGNGQKDLGGVIYGMIAADANSDGVVDGLDLDHVWEIEAGSEGYLQGDMNLDGQVNNLDKNEYWHSNIDFYTHVPE